MLMGKLFSPINVFTDDFRDDHFYLSEAIEEIARADSIRIRERHELFRLLSDRQYTQHGANSRRKQSDSRY